MFDDSKTKACFGSQQYKTKHINYIQFLWSLLRSIVRFPFYLKHEYINTPLIVILQILIHNVGPTDWTTLTETNQNIFKHYHARVTGIRIKEIHQEICLCNLFYVLSSRAFISVSACYKFMYKIVWDYMQLDYTVVTANG